MILLDRVTKTYSRDTGAALDRISLHVEPKEFVIIIGSSGAGKSTLLKLLTREEKPSSGKIIVGGIDYSKLKDKDIPPLRRKSVQCFRISSYCQVRMFMKTSRLPLKLLV